DRFAVWVARANGVTRGRLRGRDLDAPFHGVRVRADTGDEAESESSDPYERRRRLRVARARAYAPALHTGHFFSHETAASIWGAPLPLALTARGEVADAADLELHVCAIGWVPFPRASGITGHRTLSSL